MRRCVIADGVVHHDYLKKGWVIVVPIGIVITMFSIGLAWKYYYLYPIFFYINYLLCNVVSPDLDQIGVTSDEGIVLRTTKRFWVGLLGAMFVSYSFIYSYLIGLVGGHRSIFSHSLGLGTIGRMIFYNLPLYIFLLNFYSYGIRNWGWTTSISFYESCKMQVWLIPYLSMQFLGLSIGDSIHLMLDTEWAKGRLYETKRSERENRDEK